MNFAMWRKALNVIPEVSKSEWDRLDVISKWLISTRAAVLGLLLVPNVVVVNRSVEWWRSLHQDSTLIKLDPTIEGDMLVALMVGFLAMGLVFTWLMVHRFRVAWLEQQAERVDLDVAVAARRAEAGVPATTTRTDDDLDDRTGSA